MKLDGSGRSRLISNEATFDDFVYKAIHFFFLGFLRHQ